MKCRANVCFVLCLVQLGVQKQLVIPYYRFCPSLFAALCTEVNIHIMLMIHTDEVPVPPLQDHRHSLPPIPAHLNIVHAISALGVLHLQIVPLELVASKQEALRA